MQNDAYPLEKEDLYLTVRRYLEDVIAAERYATLQAVVNGQRGRAQWNVFSRRPIPNSECLGILSAQGRQVAGIGGQSDGHHPIGMRLEHRPDG